MTTLLDALQWPAMAVTLFATWLVGSLDERRRLLGFWCFIVSNGLWVLWGWHDGAHALIALQVGLLALNLRGARKTEAAREDEDDARGAEDARGDGRRP